MNSPAKLILFAASVSAGALGATLLMAGPHHSAAVPSTPQGAPRQPLAATSPSVQDPDEAIRRAYLRAWAVRAAALERLDASHLHQVLTDSALSNVIAEVNRSRKARTPARIIATHRIVIVRLDAVTASVDDEYTDTSVLLDPRTHRPITTATPRRFHKTFTLRLEDQTWKIARVIGYSS